jgi:hypothetical protein
MLPATPTSKRLGVWQKPLHAGGETNYRRRTAGERSAVIYTLLGSCRRQDINPFDCLKDLFMRLPAAKITQIKEFTPAAWAEAKAKVEVVAQAA